MPPLLARVCTTVFATFPTARQTAALRRLSEARRSLMAQVGTEATLAVMAWTRTLAVDGILLATGLSREGRQGMSRRPRPRALGRAGRVLASPVP